MNLKSLRKFVDLLQHRWDPIILDLLVDGPKRRRDLSQQVRDDNGEHISDGVLSETLGRLEDDGLITKAKAGANHAVYAATELARQKIEQLRQINEFAARLDSDGPPK